MVTWEATIKERGNDHLLHPTYSVSDNEATYVTNAFLVDFFGLNEPDVEWYKIEKVENK